MEITFLYSHLSATVKSRICAAPTVGFSEVGRVQSQILSSPILFHLDLVLNQGSLFAEILAPHASSVFSAAPIPACGGSWGKGDTRFHLDGQTITHSPGTEDKYPCWGYIQHEEGDHRLYR